MNPTLAAPSPILGIDLGTTNSLVALWQDGQARLIPNSLGEYLTPSCVSLDQDGSILVGRAARERLQTHPERSAALFKRYMGSDKRIELGGRAFRPEELSSLVLRALKDDAEAFLGVPVSEAVITVPAYFSDAQRKATRDAGQLAGLKVERLLNEPSAAALAHGIHQREGETKFLVVDLGGGTFDVSVLDLFEGVMEVRASAGDNFLGGEDFVQAIVEQFLRQHELPEAQRQDARFMQQLTARAEQAKRALSEHPATTLAMDLAGRELSMALDEATLEKLCAPLLARLRAPVERALRDAAIPLDELDSVVLAGGATRMPIVRKMVARMFGRFPSIELNPDQVVALGAAVQAGLKARDAALKEVVMTDVAPYSMGVEVAVTLGDGSHASGHFDPVIERNSSVPTSRVKRYFPISPEQPRALLRIFQGEARLARDNIHLGDLELKAVGTSGIDVRFTYDANGLLQVETTTLDSGQTYGLVIQGNPGLLDPQQIAAALDKLAALKIHPRDRLQYRTLLARGERVFQQLRGEQRNWLGLQLSGYERVLESQDSSRIDKASVQLRQLLDDIEQHSPLPTPHQDTP